MSRDPADSESNPEFSFSHDAPACTGILLTNLGTPAAPTPAAVRRYLAEFLSDRRVVELHPLLWRPLLHGIILRLRPKRAAHAYAKVWTPEGSPLLAISRRQASALQAELHNRLRGPVRVALAMRYGEPSIRAGLEQLRDAGARRLLVLPLYPQYSATTTASTFDAIARVLMGWRWLPELRMVTHYHDAPGYIRALAESIRGYWDEHGRGDKLLMSFHGLPRRNLLAGDPYHCECQKTARLLAEHLGLGPDDYLVTFQSRFGRLEWLQPYTDATLRELARSGTGRVDTVCPGFPADCLETLEEMDMQNRDIFLTEGGREYHYIPALNDDQRHIEFLADLVAAHGAGWPEFAADWDESAVQAARRASQERARALGANA